MDLWLPETARPGFVCRICGESFLRGDQGPFERHLVKCSEEHHDELVGLNADLQRFNRPLDEEWESYNADLRSRGIDPEVQYSRSRRSNIRRASES